jgi:hypothetical protein
MNHKCGWMSVLNEDCAMEECGCQAVVQFTFPDSRTRYLCATHAEKLREELLGQWGAAETPVLREVR